MDHFLLVTGAMRSGTTLMGDLLYPAERDKPAHPHLAFDNDRLTLLRLLSAHLRRRADPPIGLSAAFAAIPADPASLQSFLDSLGMVGFGEPAEPQVVRTALATWLSGEIQAVAPSVDTARMVGAKTTHLIAEIDVLRQVFSTVRTVVMVRDPRDILASEMLKAGKKQSLAVCDAILLTILAYHYFIAARRGDPAILVVRYEDLVADPKKKMREVLGHAGLDAALYDWSRLGSDRIISNSSYENWTVGELVPGRGIDAKSVGRYRDWLSPMQIFYVERLLEPFMEAWGYRRVAETRPRFVTEFDEIIVPRLRLGGGDLGLDTAAFERRLSELDRQTQALRRETRTIGPGATVYRTLSRLFRR